MLPCRPEPEARAKEKRRKARRAGQAERDNRRRARKAIPTIVETRQVQADNLPDGYTLSDFREVGDGKIIERIEHVREHFVIQQFVLQTLASKDGHHIITAATPPGVVDGGHYGPGLHAHVAVSRCDDSMPLCRSEKALERAGYGIARSTLCTIFHRTAEQLAPIYNEMKRVVRKGRYVHADETGQASTRTSVFAAGCGSFFRSRRLSISTATVATAIPPKSFWVAPLAT